MSTNIDKTQKYKLTYELLNNKEQKSIIYKTQYREHTPDENYYVYIGNLVANEGSKRVIANEPLDDIQELYNVMVLLYSRDRVPPKAKILSIEKWPY